MQFGAFGYGPNRGNLRGPFRRSACLTLTQRVCIMHRECVKED